MQESTVRVLSSRESIETLREPWLALQNRTGSVLLDFDYVMAFAGTYGFEPIRVVTVEREGAVRAIAPMRIEVRGGVEWMELFDQPTQEVHSGLLHETDADAAALCRALVRQGRPLRLVRIPATSPIADGFEVLQARHLCMRHAAPGEATAEFRFPPGGPDAAVGNDGLKKMRYSLRKADGMGGVGFDFHVPAPDEVDALMEVVVGVESSGWKAQQGTGLAQNPVMRAFFTEVARKAAARGQLVIAVMTVGGKPIAVRLATEAYGGLWDHKIGYDEAFASLSPGVLLTAETLRWSSQRGNTRHVFLGNHEKWQDRWRPESIPTVTLKIFPRSVRGLTGFAGEAFSFALKRFLSRGR